MDAPATGTPGRHMRVTKGDGMTPNAALPAQSAIRLARWPGDAEAIRALWRGYFDEYQAELGAQDFEDELAELATRYDGKAATLWVVDDGEILGTVALRSIPRTRDAELKRMVVRPNRRGLGLGGRLVCHAQAEAKRMDFSRVFLDTVPAMQTARRLYAKHGFVVCDAYYGSPLCGAIFMRYDVDE